MRCKNNLKEIGVACHNYHSQHGHLPVGTVVESADTPDKRLAWTVRILPFIEQESVSKAIDLKQGWEAPANLAATKTAIRTFLCPADHRGVTDPITVYVGAAGAGVNAAQLTLKDENAGAFGLTR